MTDRHGHPRPPVDTVRAVLDGGGRWIWLRDRDLQAAERRALAEALLPIVRGCGGTLTVGGDADLAAAVGADGVHLGGRAGLATIRAARRLLGPCALIGVSTHAAAGVAAAAAAGADYVTLSPIFETASKPGYGPALGPGVLHEACRAGIPVIALGGLTPASVPACRAGGAAGVAIMGGLMRAQDPALAVRHYLAAWSGLP
ncbi:thiamine phosphate synthase [uncultured Methylobacterium sp.]|uniref:thiamine phosphate synthase n=1 Tax=uncultured Methylobacterium sp. TaxID=157278 RepID=UPI0035C9C589